jgi:putative Ca2+/H+ antiporter (TMEM165/GDT1 family)
VDAILVSTLVSFGVIFVAELGDKSQLMALTFATRFRVWPVLLGIVSVGIGFGLGAALPTGWINLVAALAFVAFGFWTLHGDTLTEEERQKADRAVKSVVIAVGSAFFLAELGDKTMLATITLATDHGWFGTWVGSTLGMVAADALAIVVGRALGKRLPEKVIAYGAATLFFVFGIALAIEAIAQLT